MSEAMMSKDMRSAAKRFATIVCMAAAAFLLPACSNESSNKVASKDDHVGEKPGAHGHEKPGEHADEKGGHGAEAKAGGPLKLTDAQINQAGITVEQIAETSVQDAVTLTATIQPDQDRIAHVAARVPGRIVRVSATLGQRVSRGQTLAVLDSLEIGEARSVHRQARSEVSLAQADFERYERLYKEQIVPQKEWLRARAQLEKSQSALRAASEKLKLLGASPDGQGSVFPVSAPFAGIVIEKKAVVGELAEPQDMLFTVADLSTVWIEANLFEQDLGRVKVGSDAVVSVAAYPNETFRGKLSYISNTMDKETRTARARIEVPNPGEKLKLDMFATVVLQTETATKGLVVPQDAVVIIDNKPSVYVEHSGGFEARPVELGDKLQGRVVLKSGVKPGDLVVVGGAYELKARQLKSQLGSGHAH